ncbi:MAG: hypothetical protein U0Y10_09695 [Spirosomataceae bacterium]
MSTQKYLYDLHTDHKTWLSELALFEDELTIMKNRLGEVSIKNTSQEVKAQVEQFQNRFIIQLNELAMVKKGINTEERELQADISANPTAADRRKGEDDVALRDRVETFVTLFEELKAEFNQFAASWL